MSLKVLKETAPLPPSTQEELDTLSLDPIFDILGGLRHDYVRFIRNGETALIVRGLTRDGAEDVARILGFFEPLRDNIIAPHANAQRQSEVKVPMMSYVVSDVRSARRSNRGDDSLSFDSHRRIHRHRRVGVRPQTESAF